jgi:hypothetical protein
MKLVIPGLVAAIAISIATPNPARADGADVAAGLLGGLAIGAIVGGAVAPRSAPPAVYVAPAPVYVAPAPAPVYVGPTCYWAPGQPVWDGYRWVRSRVQVCD